ncbi:cytochrome P450 [Talaromyces pinophilus]|uniref:Cytochrome P450 n=1 Tax=Talaromyces pinophilus TaxID=128442 RepID=A0A510NUZ1_TALPI|nr:cytochrome P450 [Talaromyces pinophilus]
MVSPGPHQSLHRAERRSRPRRKVPLACDPCRERKSRCDGKMPICAACERRSLPLEQCVYSSDNARSERNAAYIQSLHARIRHLEGVCLAANIAPYSSDLELPADGIFAQDLPTGNESTVVDTVTALPSNFRDNVRETLTPLAPRECSMNNLASPQANAQNGTNGQTPYVIDSERDRRQPLSLFELTSNITAMGAISAPEDDERARSPDAEYYGSSSTVEFMRLARKSIKQHRTAEIDRHANRPHPELNTSAIIREACTPSTRFAFEDTPLPPRALADHLLECFWDHVFCLYPFFHRPSFQDAYENLWVPHRQLLRKLTRSDIGLGSIWASDLQSPVFQSSLNIIFALGSLKKYGEFQEMESTQMLAEYLFKPQDWYRNHYRYANSVVHRIALGERFVMSSQNLVNTQRLVAEFTGSIGASIIDWFPALAKLPKFLQPWRPYWEKIGQFHYDVYRTWWDPVKKHIDEGTAPPSFARDGLLSPDAKFSGDEQEAMYVTLQLIEAGSDTTREVLNCFVMATLCYPHKFQKLRDEIDKVCGNNAERLPVLTDIENIPYVHAFAKELLRWRPIFISTPDHMLTEDLEFEGYTFPAGTCFVINEIAVGYECESPTEFIPERWLDGTETDITHGLWQFGGGRRICVGYKLAQRSLFLNIARLAYCFDYQATGPYDSRHMNYESTGEPFPVLPTVRSEAHRELIIHEAKTADVYEEAKLEYEKVPTWRPEY